MKFLKIVFFLCFLSFISTEVLHQNKGNISVPRVKRKRATINNELEIEYTREDSDDVNCEISVRDLPLTHPIFLNEHSNVIIPINGLLRFHLNDRFKVHCGQSEFSTGGKEKTVECTGKNEFKVELNGVKVIANINDINSCSKEVTLTAVKGNKCEGGDFIHMRFIIDSHGYFDFYSSCYNEATVSTVYNKYTLYGKAFGKLIKLEKKS